jgi:hypothetical protein
MRRQMREHVDVPDTPEFLSELGANGFAVVVTGGDVYIWAAGKAAGDPSPSRCGRARYKACCMNKL